MVSPTQPTRRRLTAVSESLNEALTEAGTVLKNPISEDADTAEELHDDLVSAREQLQFHLDDFRSVHKEWLDILAKITDDEKSKEETDMYEKECENIRSLERKVVKTTLQVNRYIDKIHRKHPDLDPVPKSPGGEGDTSRARIASIAERTPAPDPVPTPKKPMAFKPPKLALPRFSGKYLEWPQFWDIFKANIHDKQDMLPIEKFSFLVAQLDGQAKQTIAGLRVNDANYDAAVKLLKQRFEKEDHRIISMLYHEFKRMPQTGKNTSDQQNTLDNCERIFRQLETAGEDLNANRGLVPDLLSKFPLWMLRDLQRFYSIGTESTLNESRQAIRELLAQEEAVSEMRNDVKDAQNRLDEKRGRDRRNDSEPSRDKGWRSDSSTTMASMEPKDGYRKFPPRGRPDGPLKCYFCQGEHFNRDCTEYPSAQTRRNRLEQLSRCMYCMRPRKVHRGPCWMRPKLRCGVCSAEGDHSAALCDKRYSVVNSPSRTGNDHWDTSQPQDNNRSSDDNRPQTHATTAVANAETTQFRDTSSGGLTAMNDEGAKTALFQTAKAWMVNPVNGKHRIVRLAMDTLSSRSYVTESVAKELELTGPPTDKLYVSVFGTNKSLEVPTKEVRFQIALPDGTPYLMSANTTPVICKAGALPEKWSPDEIRTLHATRQLLADDPFDKDGTIDILVGASLVWDFIVGIRLPTSSPHLFLLPSKFGMMLVGETEGANSQSQPTMLCLTHTITQYPSEVSLATVTNYDKIDTRYPDVDEFWDLESIGIRDDPIKNEDVEALEAFRKSIDYQDGRYQLKWPWHEDKRSLLPTNYGLAYDRFRSLVKRLKADDGLMQHFRNVLQFQESRGIIERVPIEELESSVNTVHYLPFHPVFRPSSATTKIRIVFDASAKVNRQALSLNQCLMRGPVILPDLCKLLMRTRTYRTVVISDIEKAFLHLGLQPSERDVTRFLWLKDDTKLMLTDNVMAYRFKRVTFGVISSPFLLAATIDHHLSLQNTEFAHSLRDDIYVDNVITGMDDEREAPRCYEQLKDIFQRAGMNIQEFCSNSQSFMDYIPEIDKVKNTNTKLLGLKWYSLGDDTLQVIPSSKFGGDEAIITKRSILRCIASVFDPLGLFQPVLLSAKVMLQKLWIMHRGWDEPIPESLEPEWQELRRDIRIIFEQRIPRYVGSTKDECSLAVFCDASGKAYAAVVYLRIKNSSGRYTTNLMLAKSRLAPRKRSGEKVTLPRLELLGAIIASRAGKFCREGLRLDNTKIDFFTDSECVLLWLRSKNTLRRFVANRIREIRELTHCDFHYVATEDNPADLGTRGKTTEELMSDSLWWNGPAWLTLDCAEWPKLNLDPVSDTKLREIQEETKPVYLSTTMATQEAQNLDHLKPLSIDVKDHSSLHSLLRVSAICLKFLKRLLWSKLSPETRNAKPMLSSIFSGVSDESSISAEDYTTSKLLWVRCAQLQCFDSVFQDLATGSPNNLVQQLGLEVDEAHLIRVLGRFEHADLPDEARKPLLLPKKDQFTDLIIQDTHGRVMHSGVSHTLSQVRMEFWIPHGRSQVRRVIRKCLICRRYKTAKPFKLPEMPPLPRQRLTKSDPFEYVGLDYFGPLLVTVNGEKAKMWVCLYTCLVTRAVHLEPVMDCSASEFLKCLIRFISRRRMPKVIISDNAAQFRLVKILGDHAWKRVPTDDAITSYTARLGLTWKFITELAPWQGGFYERLVGIVKAALKTSIKRKLLTWTDLVTLVTEAEAIVNSRPITYVGEDPESRFRVLRPCDFLNPNWSGVPPEPSTGTEIRTKDFGEAGKQLVWIWKRRCNTLKELWRYWYEEYLLSLRERRKVPHKVGRSAVDKTPLLGQVVLITDTDVPRAVWKVARISELIESADGKFRSAEVTLPNGTKLRRPLNHLVPLEIERPSSSDTDHSPDTTTQPPDAVAQSDSQSIPTTSGIQGPQSVDTADVEDRSAMNPGNVASSQAQGEDLLNWFSDEDIQRTIDQLREYDSITSTESA